ncbi:hypothetical protein N7504_007335 [Penicillium tannophilum]|nr:hypothetical protein N7504_007335 [Penicillium tannophilum]
MTVVVIMTGIYFSLSKALAHLQTCEVILFKVSAIALYAIVAMTSQTLSSAPWEILFCKVSTTHTVAMPALLLGNSYLPKSQSRSSTSIPRDTWIVIYVGILVL